MTTATEVVGRLVQGLRKHGVEPGLLAQVEAVLVPNYQNPDHWGELAFALKRVRNYGAADLVYSTALSVHTRWPRLWNNYAVLLRDWNRLEDALSAVGHAIELDETYSKAFVTKGTILEKSREFDRARVSYEAAIALDPSNVSATNNIGVCLLADGDATQAEAWFEKALLLDLNWTNALFNLAALKSARGDVEGAEPLISRLAQLLPEDAEVKQLQARLRDSDRERLKVSAPEPRASGKPESELKPALRQLATELAGNPSSLFISYAWPDPATGKLAARLAQDLRQHAYQVILDQEQKLEVYEILYLLAHCQNVLVLSDAHYAESCLLGRVPITQQTSSYPSFAFPLQELQSQGYVTMVFKLAAVAWAAAREVTSRGILGLAELPFELVAPDGYDSVPGLRLFIEGWRVDEIQMVFHGLDRFRSISVAYLGGAHCLAGYPLFDFSKEEYYRVSFAALLRVLELSKGLTADVGPIPFEVPDRRNYRWPDSSIVSAKMWKIAKEDVAVWRPSLTPSGEAAGIIQRFKDWEPTA